MNIILLGAPGAGKGTQAERLIEEFGLVHISTGDIFRDEIRKATPLGNKIKGLLDSGSLVADDIVLETIKGVFERRADSGYLFDGFPRTVAQAEGLLKLLEVIGEKIDFVIYIDIDDTEVIRRLTSRRTCPSCGKNYNTLTGPFPKKEGVCDDCASSLMIRKDDSESVIKERLMVYRKSTAPLIGYYKRNMPVGFVEIDGAKSIDDVFLNVKENLERSKQNS